jgi:RND family efflux transporter MFP subunit
VRSLRRGESRGARRARWIGMALLCAAVVAGCGSIEKPKIVAASSAPDAAVVPVIRKNIQTTLDIASEFLPYQEIDIYAKVSGYIKDLYVDYGTHVRQGQTMAVLEVPELKQQIEHDKAALSEAEQDLDRAKSAYAVAHITYQRLAGVQKNRPELISQEDIDVAQGKDLEADASVAAAKQAVLAAQDALAKDQTLSAYTDLTAPFPGVVTRMYAFKGALLPAGTSSNIGNSALCHLAQNDLLRLVIPVPERAVPSVHLGEPVDVMVSALNKTFAGKVIRYSDQIDMSTRTMHTEVQVPNPSFEIVPGMYASVKLPIQTAPNALVVPIQSVQSSGNGVGTVLVVDSSDHIQPRTVKLGLQTATEVEIVSGLQENEKVVFGAQSQFHAGELVKPIPTSAGLEQE